MAGARSSVEEVAHALSRSAAMALDVKSLIGFSHPAPPQRSNDPGRVFTTKMPAG